MSKGNFRKYVDKIQEETTAGDIASVDNIINLGKDRESFKGKDNKGKKCRIHNRLICKICQEDLEESRWR
jgi:hypothetical protein